MLEKPPVSMLGRIRIIIEGIFAAPAVEHFQGEKLRTDGRGFSHNGKEFVHHSELSHHETAFYVLSALQKFWVVIALLIAALALVIDWHSAFVLLFSLLTVVYFIDLFFNLYLITRSFSKLPEIKVGESEIENYPSRSWPIYTIFCPLYKEWQVVPQFVRAMQEMDYPKNRLQIMLLLEADDIQTIDKINEYDLPKNFQVVVVPHSMPKTKPKAMNYGLQQARGTYITIYDAEDVPDPLQLKKAVIAFQQAPKNIVCIQAKLNFYNPTQNLLTRIFTAEYSLWFDLVLPGLQSVGAPIPLGGTSNHFRAEQLRGLSGWDAFNVTEDCDLGMRLAKRGYQTAMIDSTTLEEANSDWKNWYRQRSRWIKGYIQTYLVHMRKPGDFVQPDQKRHLPMFQLVIGGKIMSMFINPFLWVITIAYFAFRSHVGLFIESFFPTTILYIGAFSLVFGNFLYLFYYMIGCAKRGFWPLIKYAYIVPFYWLYMSAAAWQAVYEIIVKPHYWAKTVHGLHLDGLAMRQSEASLSAVSPGAVIGNISVAETDNFISRTKKLFNTGFGSGAALIAAMVAANFLNFVFNALLGRALTLEDFGTVTLFNTVLNIMAVALGALASSVNYKTAYLVGQNKLSLSARFVQTVLKKVWGVTALLSVVWIGLIPLFGHFFHISHLVLVLYFTTVISFGSIAATQSGFLRGRFRFGMIGKAIVYEALSKTILAVALVDMGYHEWTAASIPLSIIISFAVTQMYVRKVKRQEEKLDLVEDVAAEPFPSKYFSASVLSGIAGAVFLNVDVLLAKHFLSPMDAGAYSLLSLVGKMVFLLGSLLSVFIVSIVSKHEGAKTSAARDFYKLFLGTILVTMAAFVLLGVYGQFTVPLLFGSRSAVILPYLLPYCFAMVLFTFANTFVGYHLVKRQYVFSWIMLGSAGFLVFSIIKAHGSIAQFAHAMLLASIASFSLIFITHIIWSSSFFLLRNVTRILNVLWPLRGGVNAGNGKRILVFNWRDTEHAYAGGAEVYVHELAKRWVEAGNQVTVFCGNDQKSLRSEIIDGVTVIRRGGFYFVYAWAFIYYITKFRGRFDIIVDCQNGIPFFTPLYATEKIYCLMHHVHQEVFRRHLAKPLALFASFLEKTVMPAVYHSVKFITISDSSKEEMKNLGLGQAGMEIVYPGVDLLNLEPGLPHAEPLVLYLGRLKAYKSVDVLIRAFKLVIERMPKARLVIAGDGEEKWNLKKLVGSLDLTEHVMFTGKVTEKEKISLFKKSWVFCNPSMMEGWGITTIEANACGVPVVAANVPGLRDSVNNPHTGYLVEHGNVEKFAEKILKILTDEELQIFMRQESITWAQKFDWDFSARKSLEILYE